MGVNKMATQKKIVAEVKTVTQPKNSKGFRKSFDGGVVGWQVYLQAMRMFVNINQYGSAISADKKLIDYTLKGIAMQDKYLAIECKPPIRVPSKLAGRRAMALKASHPSFNDTHVEYAKALRELVGLYKNRHATKECQSLIKLACQNAVRKASDKARLTNRLRKNILDLV